MLELGLILKDLLFNVNDNNEGQEGQGSSTGTGTGTGTTNENHNHRITLKEKFSAKEKCRLRWKRKMIRRCLVVLFIAFLIEKLRVAAQ